MSHLSLETIARLVEDEPDATESAHLATCTECRAQLDAMSEDVHALGMLPDMAAAPDQWNDIERRLTAEGLIRTPSHRFVMRGTGMMQIAAAVMLFFGGTLAGRMTAQQPAPLADAAPSRSDAPAVTPSGADSGSPLPSPSRIADPSFASVAPDESVNDDGSAARPVTLASNAPVGRAPASMEEAALFLRQTEAAYLDALTGYAEMASQAQSGDPIARLAALQSIILTTQAALNETPTDPVINGYHLAALAQRDVTLQQVAQASTERWY